MAVLNITYNGLSADYPLDVDYKLSDADVRRIAIEVVRAGGVRGLQIANLPDNAFERVLFCDFDRVESKNILAQAYVKQSIGKNKAEALKLQLSNFWGWKTESSSVKIGEENIDAVLGTSDLLIDAF